MLGGVKNPGDLYSGILKSKSIADELIKRFDLMNVYKVKKVSLAEKALASDTDIAVDTKSSIVRVEVTDKSGAST
jgi:capsular polysaccharide biosynthesis protein